MKGPDHEPTISALRSPALRAAPETAPQQHRGHAMTVVDLTAALASIPRDEARAGLRHLVLGQHRAAEACSVGVAVMTRDSSPSFWEAHDGGDELLMMLEGAARFTIRHADGHELVRLVRTGETLLIPRGAAHAAQVLEDSKVFFVTPAAGSRSWEAAPRVILDA